MDQLAPEHRLPSLTVLANRHGSDKGTSGPTPGWPGHNYTDIYEAYLGRLRNSQLRLLEIGLGVPGDNWDARIAQGRNATGGASVKMWHDFFPHADIVGLDINPATHLDNNRIRTEVLDQGDPEQLRKFRDRVGSEAFDVIVDDGSHRPDHQQLTLSLLFSTLKSGGFYFIEDLGDNGLGGTGTGRHSSPTVLDTRKVLKSYLESGEFAAPNACEALAFVAEIDSVAFHVPRPRVRLRRPKVTHLRRPSNILRPVLRFPDDSESLCVIRKR